MLATAHSETAKVPCERFPGDPHMNRTRLLALAIALTLATPSAHAQDSADPKFCESLKSILAATPKGKWPEKPGQTLTWEGGSRACSSGRDGTTLTCPIYDTQMLSTCTLFVRPPPRTWRKTPPPANTPAPA